METPTNMCIKIVLLLGRFNDLCLYNRSGCYRGTLWRVPNLPKLSKRQETAKLQKQHVSLWLFWFRALTLRQSGNSALVFGVFWWCSRFTTPLHALQGRPSVSKWARVVWGGGCPGRTMKLHAHKMQIQTKPTCDMGTPDSLLSLVNEPGQNRVRGLGGPRHHFAR